MKTFWKVALAAGALGTAALAVPTTPALAYSDVNVSFNAGDVAFGYRDGYWDRYHRWHRWHDRDEWAYYRHYHPGAYRDFDHDRDDYWRARWRHYHNPYNCGRWGQYCGHGYHHHDYDRDYDRNYNRDSDRDYNRNGY